MANVTRSPPALGSNRTPQVNKRSRTDYPLSETLISAHSDGNANQTSINNMMNLMMAQFTETKQLIDAVRTELGEINGKIDAVKTELQNDITSLKKECAAKFQHNDAVLDSLKQRVNSVTQNISALENRNELIISGIPYQSGENLNNVVEAICTHLSLKKSTALLTETRRMTTGSRTDGNGLIVLEFALKQTRDEFYSAYLRKRDLRLRHVGLDSDRRVYINESLAGEARKAKTAAIRLKRDGKLAAVYTKLGFVYVKRTVDGPSIAIRSEGDLNEFL